MSGKVVLFHGTDPIAFHEKKRHESLARIIAEIKGYEFAGYYDEASHAGGALYFVPHYTVVGVDVANDLRIRTENDLFGGAVPYWFVGTKAIMHELIGPEAVRPPYWNTEFSHEVRNYVLPGYTAFSPRDAYEAAARLLATGPIRLKDVCAAGGTGQIVVRTGNELEDALQSLANKAVVVERNLEEITTYSIGQIYLHGIRISYWGTQRETHDNAGRTAYGGSDLHIMRGSLGDVHATAKSEEARLAIQSARAFDDAIGVHYPDVLASRRNYDVGVGRDANGVFRCGVLDQSWRIGGTSGPEILAASIFRQQSHATSMEGSSFNVYGGKHTPPGDAIVHFHEVDHEFGPMLMYTLVRNVR